MYMKNRKVIKIFGIAFISLFVGCIQAAPYVGNWNLHSVQQKIMSYLTGVLFVDEVWNCHLFYFPFCCQKNTTNRQPTRTGYFDFNYFQYGERNVVVVSLS